MRREILLPLLGFLGGFVVAAMVFWQPVAQPNKATQPVTSEASPARETAPAAGADYTRRRLVVTARENEGVAPVAESAPKPQGAAEIFHEALGKLKGMGSERSLEEIILLVKQLRVTGPEGLQVVRDYFRAGQDVRFERIGESENGVSIQSLRMALLNKLGAWPANETLDFTREILRTTSSLPEAFIAIGQIEKNSPGNYRDEAVQTLQKLASVPEGERTDRMPAAQLIEAVKQFKATELLPAAEAAVGDSPWYAARLIVSLEALPADARTTALQRLLANDNLTKKMMQDELAMRLLNYSEPATVENVARLFTANTDKQVREKFLINFANTQFVAFLAADGIQTGDGSGDKSPDRIARIQSRIAFLDTIAPQCITPALQELLQGTREALQKAVVETLQRNATTDKK